MLKNELLDILACPKCKGDLVYKPDNRNDTKGVLECHACRLIFAVEDDIPIMLLDEAVSLNDSDEDE